MGRWMSGIAVGVLGATLAMQAFAQGNVYRWTDKEGKVHFSDAPPPDDARDVSQKRIAGDSPDASALPYESQVAMKRHPVTLYIADKCAPCDDARALLSSRGIPYTERNAQGNAKEIEALTSLAGAAQVPLLQVGERTLKGFDASAWNSALDTAGYPRTVLPGRRAPEPVRVGGPDAAAPPTASPSSQPR
jgi:glutaredoxin